MAHESHNRSVTKLINGTNIVVLHYFLQQLVFYPHNFSKKFTRSLLSFKWLYFWQRVELTITYRVRPFSIYFGKPVSFRMFYLAHVQYTFTKCIPKSCFLDECACLPSKFGDFSCSLRVSQVKIFKYSFLYNVCFRRSYD